MDCASRWKQGFAVGIKAVSILQGTQGTKTVATLTLPFPLAPPHLCGAFVDVRRTQTTSLFERRMQWPWRRCRTTRLSESGLACWPSDLPFRLANYTIEYQ